MGISLHGRESRSGHRHLDSRGSFARNALDIFHIATDTSLGNIWKIRIWHDNKGTGDFSPPISSKGGGNDPGPVLSAGLSPAWMLQYVLVKDLQTGSSYYFLVEEWLSVDNEKTDGRVEIEAEASGKVRPPVDPASLVHGRHPLRLLLLSPEEASLLLPPRLLKYELQRALCESHLWLSLLERPPRSPFTRLQRATCCALLLQLLVLANTLWYSIVVDVRHRWRHLLPISLSLSHVETVTAGFLFSPPQPATRVKAGAAERRDGGCGRGHLSGCVPSLLAGLHAVQNEPQQGTKS